MKKTKKKKNNDTKKILITLAIVILIIVIIGGATFAYWSWETNTAQRTNVTVTVEGATLTIVGNNITNTGMYPTTECDGTAALVGDVATVTADNDTESSMQVALKLRVSLYAPNGTLNSTNKGKLNWAIVDTSTTATCASPTKSGTFTSVTHATLSSAFPNTTYTDIDTGETFIVSALSEISKTYRVYVWLDSTYEYTNTGSTISDPMQELQISVKWSPASTMNQQY